MSADSVSAIAKRFKKQRLAFEEFEQAAKVRHLQRSAQLSHVLMQKEAQIQRKKQYLKSCVDQAKLAALFPPAKSAYFLKKLMSARAQNSNQSNITDTERGDTSGTRLPDEPITNRRSSVQPITARESVKPIIAREKLPTILERKAQDTDEVLTQGRKLLGIGSKAELKNFKFEPSGPFPPNFETKTSKKKFSMESFPLGAIRKPIRLWPVQNQSMTFDLQGEKGTSSSQSVGRPVTSKNSKKQVLMRNFLTDLLAPAPPADSDFTQRLKLTSSGSMTFARNQVKGQETDDYFTQDKTIMDAMGGKMLKPFSFLRGSGDVTAG